MFTRADCSAYYVFLYYGIPSMLQKLNERIQGVVAWVVIILVAVTFTLFGIDYYIQSRHELRADVEVNGQPITKQAFDLNYRRARQMRDPSQMTAELENQLKQQVMDEMVANTVSLQAAHANGFEVSVAEANAAILSIPQFQQDGHFSTDKYQQALNGALFTPESFQKEVSQGMLLNQQRFAFMGTSFALPAEIKRFVKLYMQTRDYDYLKIPARSFFKPADVTATEIDAYYKDHPKEFLSHETVTVDFIRLSMSDIKGTIKLTDQQIARYYEENQSNYYTPAQWQVAHILFAIPPETSAEDRAQVKTRAFKAYHALQKSPEQFESDVRTLSDDKATSAHGGVLPWVVAGQSEFDKALVHLTTPGKMSAPVKSKQGYEIFKVIAYKPAAVKPLPEVKADIHAQLLADIAQTEYAQLLEKLSDLSYQSPDSLIPAGDTLKLTIQQTTPFSRQGGDSALTKNKQVIHAAFSHDVLVLGNNSEPIPLDNESVVVLRVNKHTAAVAMPLSEVKPVIVEKLAMNKAKIAARELGRLLLQDNHDRPRQDHAILEHHLAWLDVTAAARDSDLTLPAINDLAFGISGVGSEMGHSLDTGDYVMVRLKKINDGELQSLDKEQVRSITQQIEASYGMMDYDLYVGDLMSKATVVKH